MTEDTRQKLIEACKEYIQAYTAWNTEFTKTGGAEKGLNDRYTVAVEKVLEYLSCKEYSKESLEHILGILKTMGVDQVEHFVDYLLEDGDPAEYQVN